MNPEGSNTVVFDLEIKKSINTTGGKINPETEVNGWGESHLAGISVLVLYDYETGQYRVFDDHNMTECISRLERAERVVGYNHISFDYKVMRGSGYSIDFSPLKDFDLLAQIRSVAGKGGGLKLDLVAQETLGISKSGDGAFAPELYQQGRWAELVDYCIQDVKVTKDLYDHMCKGSAVIARGGQEFKVPV